MTRVADDKTEEKFKKAAMDILAEIKITPGLDRNNIELFQAIEKDIDKVMVSYGFTRSETTKAGDRVELIYRQFGVCLENKE